jgi:hypothetical protein
MYHGHILSEPIRSQWPIRMFPGLSPSAEFHYMIIPRQPRPPLARLALRKILDTNNPIPYPGRP